MFAQRKILELSYLLISLLLITILTVGFWIKQFNAYPNLDTGAIFALFHHDIEIPPLISRLLDFSFRDPMVNEKDHVLHPCPYAILLPHAILYRIFGASAYVIAEMAFVILRFILLVCFINAFVRSRMISICISLSFESGLLEAILYKIFTVTGFFLFAPENIAIFNPIHYQRITRPLVSFPYFIFSLWTLICLCYKKKFQLKCAIGIGVSLSLLLNGNFYGFIVCLLTACFLVLIRVTQQRINKIELYNYFFTLVILLLGSIPLLLNIFIFPNSELFRRGGEFKISYAVFCMQNSVKYTLLIIILISILKIIIDHPPFLKKILGGIFQQQAFLFFFFVLVSSSLGFLFMPTVLGKTIQEEHFFQYQDKAVLLFLLMEMALFLRMVTRFLRKLRMRMTAIYCLCIFIFCGVLWQVIGRLTRYEINTYHPRADFDGYYQLGKNYANDFNELYHYLNNVAPYKVVLSFDTVVVNYLVAFRKKFAYCPISLNTTIFDSEIDERLLYAFRLLGVTPSQISRLLKPHKVAMFHNAYIEILFGGYAKYSVSRRYSIAPLSDYPIEFLDKMFEIHYSPWPLIIRPKSTFIQMEKTLKQLPKDAWKKYQLDLIILLNNSFEKNLNPDPKYFHLLFSNNTFRVFKKYFDEK